MVPVTKCLARYRGSGKGRIDLTRQDIDGSAAATFGASWREQSPALRLLRVFLGVTFLYAGLQKLADRNFFRSGTPTYIGGQLHAFATGSPIAPVLQFLSHYPILTGLVVALGETVIGLAVLLGIGALVAAIFGCLISAALWLSATWHVHPFFLGSDSIYTVAWATCALSLWEARAAREGSAGSLGTLPVIDRRSFLRAGVIGGATLGFAAVARGLSHFGPAATSARGLTAAGGGSRSGGAAASSRTVAPSPTPAATASPLKGQVIGSLSNLQVGQPVAFVSHDGTPAALFRLSKDKVVAYSRLCTHAGCTVGYDPSSQVLYCPCHGAQFDPNQGARVLAGPAPIALPKIKVAIDPTNNNVVLPR